MTIAQSLVLFALVGCSGAGGGVSSVDHGSILFVHGAFQNANVWAEMRRVMEAKGYRTDAVALPREVGTNGPKLVDYARQITETGRRMQAPVWLVVHSFGGMHGTVAVATPNDPFEGIIYVASYAPQPGESMQGLASTDATNRFSDKNFLVAQDYTYASVLADDRAMLFCNDCSAELATQVAQAMVREPLGPIAEKVDFDPAELHDDRRGYVVTTQDNAVGTELQRKMVERAGIQAIEEIPTGHTPFLGRPDELAAKVMLLMTRARRPSQ